MTETELNVIAALAIIGESNMPNIGNRIPEATGMRIMLCAKAKKRFADRIDIRFFFWLRCFISTDRDQFLLHK